MTKIGKNAFDNCWWLRNVILSKSVASVEALAFYYCESLRHVTIQNSAISIEASAFECCWNPSLKYAGD
ncbi:MAG: leucine-rich repeat domain-containing protein [Clostridiales bacterium]|nr:leucine-rich repeat domain-containing protein [Clostridiales bacterium]